MRKARRPSNQACARYASGSHAELWLITVVMIVAHADVHSNHCLPPIILTAYGFPQPTDVCLFGLGRALCYESSLLYS